MSSILLETSIHDTTMFQTIKDNKYIEEVQPSSYINLTVKKPWGCEFLFFNETNISGWILYINKNNSTSFHCHNTKDTPMIILKGKVIIHTNENKYYLEKGDYIHIPKGKFHSIEAENDSIVCEFEIKPNKTDLFRLYDKYGRNQKGYEGICYMSEKLDVNRCFYLEKNNYNNNDFFMSMQDENNQSTHKVLRTFYILIDGKLQENNKYLSEGTLLNYYPKNNDIKVLKIQILDSN